MKQTKMKPCTDCKSAEFLTIDSSGSMGITEVSCDCGHVFQSECFEENVAKYWNRHVRSANAQPIEGGA